MDVEIFKDAIGYEGKYMVGNFGTVISLPKGKATGNANRIIVLKTDKYIANKNATYHRVTFCVNGKTKRFSVHRLVAELFVPNPENKPDVNHIDSNPSNNRFDNLEWVTVVENSIHGYEKGYKKIAVMNAGRANRALSFDDAMAIIQIKKDNPNISQRELGLSFNVDRRTIGKILRGKTYGFA